MFGFIHLYPGTAELFSVNKTLFHVVFCVLAEKERSHQKQRKSQSDNNMIKILHRASRKINNYAYCNNFRSSTLLLPLDLKSLNFTSLIISKTARCKETPHRS